VRRTAKLVVKTNSRPTAAIVESAGAFRKQYQINLIKDRHDKLGRRITESVEPLSDGSAGEGGGSKGPVIRNLSMRAGQQGPLVLWGDWHAKEISQGRWTGNFCEKVRAHLKREDEQAGNCGVIGNGG